MCLQASTGRTDFSYQKLRVHSHIFPSVVRRPCVVPLQMKISMSEVTIPDLFLIPSWVEHFSTYNKSAEDDFEIIQAKLWKIAINERIIIEEN